MILGAVAAPGAEALITGLMPGTFAVNAPGELVALVHNHPSSNPDLSDSDQNWFNYAESIHLNGINDELVMYIGTGVTTAAPNGTTITLHPTAHTDGDTAPVNPDGTTGCTS